MMSYEYKSLDFFQIYYDEKQKDSLYDFATPYYNETITHYFENSIIKDLVPNSQADLISVCSWRLKQKRGDLLRTRNETLTKDKILNADFDVAILTPRHPNHKPLLMASEWHRVFDSEGRIIATPWDDAFSVFKEFLKFHVGINVPNELTHAIYENHFIAKAEIYKEYVRNWLYPAIRFMDANEIFRANGGYVTKKRDSSEVKSYQEKSGRTDWPIGVFILERLFSIYCEGRGFKIVNL